MGPARGSVGVVIPCYRSPSGFVESLRGIAAILRARGEAVRIVCVDDASPDDGATWRALLGAKDELGDALTIIRLARNVGQHAALLCGMASLPPECDRVVTMDDDGQHAPEDIPNLLSALDAGADLAVGAYGQKQHDRFRNLAGGLLDGLLRRLFGLPGTFHLTSFRAMRRFVADEAVEGTAGYGYLTASLLAATARRANVPVHHGIRKEGPSGYTLGRSLSLAANLILSHSRLPFLAMLVIGGASFIFSLASIGYVVFLRFEGEGTVPGWASLMLMIGLQSTMLMGALATILIYVSRSHRLLAGQRVRWRVADVR